MSRYSGRPREPDGGLIAGMAVPRAGAVGMVMGWPAVGQNVLVQRWTRYRAPPRTSGCASAMDQRVCLCDGPAGVPLRWTSGCASAISRALSASGLRIPPTSNQAERDLRPAKIQQKISGRLRSEQATRHGYAIRGYLSTAAKHGINVLAALRDALGGNPLDAADPRPSVTGSPVTSRHHP
jgi:hypothetical protein